MDVDEFRMNTKKWCFTIVYNGPEIE